MGWDRTIAVENRLEKVLDEKKTYFGRHIISRDSPINQGVYMGGHPREAIVVNFEKSPQLQLAYFETKQRIMRKAGEIYRHLVLPTTYQIVKEKLEYSDYKTEQIIKKYNSNNDQKISLGLFLEEGHGVCRHQALLAGGILEQFIDEGYIRGKVSVDRNSFFHSAHAWCRYTSSKGIVMILDPTQDFIGTLKNSLKICSWDYRRDEDK